jgi:pimeloyl-ACP methyl ester carboxylesterase
MQIVVDNLLATYDKTGHGPVVLLVHGWGDSLQTFSGLADSLENSFTLVSLDLPGFGGTQPPDESWGVDDYARFVSLFLKKSNLKPYAIIAHSNGGTIVIRGLANGDLKAEKLVLLASAGIRDVYKGRRKSLRLAAKAAKVATYPLPKSVQMKIKKKAYKAIGSDLFVAEHLQDTFKRVVTDDVQADARKLHLPTILIYGSKDDATPPKYGELLNNAVTGSTLHIVHGAGHFVHHEQPDEVLRIVEEFLT